ncbi:MAG: hypothetical protein WC878_07975 [Candidatus Paceibacterota bacterium]|jgi:hypothetical protein
MNAFSIIVSLLNAVLLASSVGGYFMDVPVRKELANKERVQTALMQTVSERDAEVIAVEKRREELEREIPRIPGKIEEAKKAFELQASAIGATRNEKEKASSTLAVMQQRNAEKARELERLLRRNFAKGKKGATVFLATFYAPKDEDLKIQRLTVRDSLRDSDGETVWKDESASDFAVSNAIPRLELWDSGKLLAEADQNFDGSFLFLITGSSTPAVSAGGSKTLFIKADISSSARTGERHRILLIGDGAEPAISVSNIKTNAPVFVIGDTPISTIALGELEKKKGGAGEKISFEWSILNAPRNAKTAILFEDTDKKQTIIAKNLSAFAGRASAKIVPEKCAGENAKCALAPGNYSVIAVLYDGNDFCIGCKGTGTPSILASGRADVKFQILGAE